MLAWCSQNTGSFGELSGLMWPPTHSCTRLWMFGPIQPSSWFRKLGLLVVSQGALS
ncbi:hypothetical protein Save01_00025 [Streptomyces avermitilis]